MRNEFEKLRLIQVAIDNGGAYWCGDKCGYTGYDCDFVNGAWYAYQEQQKKIDDVKHLIDKLKESEKLDWQCIGDDFDSILK